MSSRLIRLLLRPVSRLRHALPRRQVAGVAWLLAVRLAERHGISLHDDPAAARRLLCPGHRDDRLWYWVDPARPPATTGTQSGIPPRTLARLIDRLEKL